MNQDIKADLFRNDGEKSLLRGFRTKQFRYLYFWRLASLHKRNTIPGLFYRLFVILIGNRYGFQIPPHTKIGGGLFIGHFGPIVINPDVTIGVNCNIGHCTTIGQTNRGKRRGSPKIGDRVWIGTGAVLVGKIVIGDNVLIAPNSFVNFDVPSNALVIGNPAKIVPKEDATNGYINYPYNF